VSKKRKSLAPAEDWLHEKYKGTGPVLDVPVVVRWGKSRPPIFSGIFNPTSLAQNLLREVKVKQVCLLIAKSRNISLSNMKELLEFASLPDVDEEARKYFAEPAFQESVNPIADFETGWRLAFMYEHIQSAIDEAIQQVVHQSGIDLEFRRQKAAGKHPEKIKDQIDICGKITKHLASSRVGAPKQGERSKDRKKRVSRKTATSKATLLKERIHRTWSVIQSFYDKDEHCALEDKKVLAKAIGIHPATLRQWERDGLDTEALMEQFTQEAQKKRSR
jgi:hypothetical protein